MKPDTVAWLLAGDPAVAWQVQRDLLGRAERTWSATRRRVATEGWGRRLLAERAVDGTWGGGLYGPKWTSTFYTLQLLSQLGLPPSHTVGKATCRLLLDEGVTDSGGVRLWKFPATDACVTGMLLSIACHFGLAEDERAKRMVGSLLAEQMGDGGWNCEAQRTGATHSSFHTTISVLEGLAAYSEATGKRRNIDTAAAAGREFFLEHQLYRSSTTGKEIKRSFSMLSFPPRWFFDVLRGLDHFRVVNAERDERLTAAIEVVESKRRADGRWHAQNTHTGRTYFRLEPARQPSRMNTLRAQRVLEWWHSGRPVVNPTR